MINKNGLLQMLQNGCEKLHLHLGTETQLKIIDYVLLLKKWNKTYNLTAINAPEKIITHHILDSLAVVPYIAGNNILDVGSGAGLPGIILALALPQKYFVLLDSNHKKTRFLVYVIATLKIPNAEVVNQRIEMYNPQISVPNNQVGTTLAVAQKGHGQAAGTQTYKGNPHGYPFDTIITRAFAPLKEILDKTKKLCNSGCCLLAMKGKVPTKEIEEINRPVIVYNLEVPGLNEERHLVVIK